MTPARIRELRRSGVLDGTRADEARIALLDLYEQARGYQRERAPSAAALRDEIGFALDAVMRDTDRGRALRWAAAEARRRARREPDHAAELDAVKARRGRLISLAVDGTITPEDLRARLAKLDAEVGRLERAIADARRRAEGAARAARPEVRVELLAHVETLTAAWQRAPVGVRREVLRRLVARIEVEPPEPWVHVVPPPRITWRTVEEMAAEK